jgi:SAM-dependent methyltransferase
MNAVRRGTAGLGTKAAPGHLRGSFQLGKNLDANTVAGFADEWTRLDQSRLPACESRDLFESYFRLFPWQDIKPDAVGFDAGCGTGRWARHVAQRATTLHCIDASDEVIAVARRNLRDFPNCVFHVASICNIPLEEGSADFGYCLGVLHHVPDTVEGIRACVSKLKRGSPLLLYLYYAFDNRPRWFRALWKATDLIRCVISRTPPPVRYGISQVIAAVVYFPLARGAGLAESFGCDVSRFPLSFYRNRSFYTMRTDALDRFGTRLEHRFSASEIEQMMRSAGLERIKFNEGPPFWCALGYRAL